MLTNAQDELLDCRGAAMKSALLDKHCNTASTIRNMEAAAEEFAPQLIPEITNNPVHCSVKSWRGSMQKIATLRKLERAALILTRRVRVEFEGNVPSSKLRSINNLHHLEPILSLCTYLECLSSVQCHMSDSSWSQMARTFSMSCSTLQ